MAENNTQSRKWLLTINNPLGHGLSHTSIVELLSSLKNVGYYCLCDEEGDECSTLHTHVFLFRQNPLRFSALKNKFPAAHIDQCRGLCSENRAYVLKEGEKYNKSSDGRYDYTDSTGKKHCGLNYSSTFEEFGEIPEERQGERTDMSTSICSNSDMANEILNSINGFVIDLYDNSTNCITYLEKVENILSTQLVAINNSLKGISIDDLSIQAIIDGISASITFEPSDLSGVEEYLESILNQISHISSVVDAISEKLDISNEWFAQFASDLFDIKSDVGFCSTYLQGLYNTLLGMDDDIAAMRDFLEENNANILLILQEVQAIHSSLGNSVGATLDEILRNLVSQGTDLGSIKSLLSSIKDNSDAAANTLEELLKELQKVETENVLTNERLKAILDAIDDFEIDVSKTSEKILTDEDSKGLGGLISKIINHLLSVIDFVSDLFGDVFTSIPSTISAFNDCNQFWGDTKTYVYTPHQISGYSGQGGGSFDNSNTSVQLLFSEAEKYLGYSYVFGGSSPETSFDCSGYVCYVLNHSGVYSIERTSAQGIYNLCEPISRSVAKPGDLVFFSGTYDCTDIVSHVGFYAGNGKMLHCGDVRPDRAKVEVDERRIDEGTTPQG